MVDGHDSGSCVEVTGLDRWLQQLAQQPPLKIDVAPPAGEVLGIFPPWLQTAIRIFFALLPILLILGLLLLARSRARLRAGADEERESLWSWAGLAEDLRGLLAGLRGPQRAGGLRAALAALRGGDPASRVRRSYIRLLLLGEAHEPAAPCAADPARVCTRCRRNASCHSPARRRADRRLRAARATTRMASPLPTPTWPSALGSDRAGGKAVGMKGDHEPIHCRAVSWSWLLCLHWRCQPHPPFIPIASRRCLCRWPGIDRKSRKALP